MSFEFQAKLICDNCKETRSSGIEDRVTLAKTLASNLLFDSMKIGWMRISRGPFKTPAHYCPKCVDKPTKPIPRKIRG